MSELIQKDDDRATIRWKLLASVSAAALIASGFVADAADADKPSLWLQLGWHYEDIGNLGDVFVPPFADALTAAGFPSASGIQRRMGYDYGGEAGLTFAPNGSDWSFSASLRYGRAHGRGKMHEETAPASYSTGVALFRSGSRIPIFFQLKAPDAKKFDDARASNSETHAIIDFQAGKDVGIGIGTQSTSQLNFGVRFAQFHSRSAVNISADPDFHFVPQGYTIQFTSNEYARFYHVTQYFHHDGLTGGEDRNFKGLGPSISWDASTALAGNRQDGELDIDWGINAALLFGQQRTRIQRQVRSKLFDGANYFGTPGIYTTHGPTTRSRRVAVPNAGAFAGISYRFIDAELKLGYRADLFFNAMDGGIDTRHELNQNFYGPFASISIGFGGSSD